jgi:NADPH:quinone reductase-like Zn-dependent oxidoreductase
MRAWELSAFGLDKLKRVERPEPEPGPGQVKLRVQAAALNSRDLQVIANQYDPNQRLPIVPGSDGVGIVVAVGAGVTRVRPGDRVVPTFAQGWIAGERSWPRWLTTVGGHYDGLLQDYCVLEAEGVCPAPAHLNDVEAAACGAAAATAWEALVERGGLHAGQTVLVQGTGGVAMFALQFARLHGARVLVTSSSDDKLARARALGAADGINYRSTPDWHRAVLDLTGGEGVDHVVETAGDLERSVACLRPSGLVSLVGYSSQLALDSGAPPVYRYTVGVLPMLMQQARLQALTAAPRESCERMLRAIERNGLKPVIGAEFDFDAVPAALQAVAAGHAFGKICVRVGD